MSCGRATRVDVEAYLLDRGAAEFDDFRAHFPECAECAAAVAGWTTFDVALHDLLGEEGRGVRSHPLPGRLEAWLAAPESLGDGAIEIQEHVSSCLSCQTELSVMRGFDAALGVVVPSAATAPAVPIGDGATRSIGQRLRIFFESLSADSSFDFGLGRIVLPALATASIAIFGLWLARGYGGSGAIDDPSGEAQMAGRPSSPALDSAPGSSPRTPSTVVPESLARVQDGAAPADGASSPEATQETSTPEALRLADAAIEESDPALLDAPAKTPVPGQPLPQRLPQPIPEETPAPREEILLAALSDLPLPSYAAPPGSVSVAWMTQFDAARTRREAPMVEVRAPSDHTGLTSSTSPRLWWFLSADTELPVEIMVVDPDGIDPLLSLESTRPHEAGLHSIDLAEHGVELEPGIEIRWFVSLLVDPDDSSNNPVAAGSLRVIPGSDTRRQSAEQARGVERGHVLAQLGLWYDAYDFFASLSDVNPGDASILRHRDRMRELVRSGP